MESGYISDYYNHEFIEEVNKLRPQITKGGYCMVAVDVKHFKLFNKLYGRKAGNELIRAIYEYLEGKAKEYQGVFGYLGADNFALVIKDDESVFNDIKDYIIEQIRQWNDTVGFYPMLGIYKLEDNDESVASMYDRASIAVANISDDYLHCICRYNAAMESELERKILLLADIQKAIENDEFTFYAQPQCNISSGRIVGAEALVRWIKPDGSMVSPGVFIPVLEENGMIGSLDKIVWEKVCAWLRSWIDKGFEPVPISINVSRIDILSMDVAGFIEHLLVKYHIPEHLLKIEITESAYTESNETITATVNTLREKGFKVMMDDFGCGYSSLNMLKNIPVDVLKLDMRFLDINDSEEEKGMNILESVVNMARLLRLPIVVEGVENEKQEKFVKSLGCRYIQGFYYYRPLPIDKFEELLTDDNNLDHRGLLYKQVEPLHIREFIDSNFISDSMLNNIMGPVAFYDVCGSNLDITRVNEQYIRLAGTPSDGGSNYGKRFWNHVKDSDRVHLFDIFENAYENKADGAEGYIHFIKMDYSEILVYIRVFFMKEKDGHRQFCASLMDMTEYDNKRITSYKLCPAVADDVHNYDEEELKQFGQYYDNLPMGICIDRVNKDDNGNVAGFDIIYANKMLRNMCDGNLPKLKSYAVNNFGGHYDMIHNLMYETAYNGSVQSVKVYSHVSNKYLRFVYFPYKEGYIGSVMLDITESYIAEKSLKTIVSTYNEAHYIHLQDNYYDILYPFVTTARKRGNYEEALERHFQSGTIVSDNEENVRKFLSINNLKNVLKENDSADMIYKRRVNDGRVEWDMTSVVVTERDDDNAPVNAVMLIKNVDEIIRGAEDKRSVYISDMLTSMSEGFFIYKCNGDEKVLFANAGTLNMFGCEKYAEFGELTGNSFKGMVHPDDIKRVESEINRQIKTSDNNMDYIKYRIIRKDGSIRWIEDFGHLENAGLMAESGYYYVFIADITDTITEAQKNHIYMRNKYYNNTNEN